MVEDITRLFIMSGQPVSNTIHQHQGGRMYNGKWFNGEKDLNLIYLKRSKNYYIRIKNITRPQYSGHVYCVSVPNKIICVRRNGKITWCGNSWKDPRECYINSPYEGILILYKDHWRKDVKGVSDISGKEFMQSCSGSWKLQPEMNGLTKANFPVSLPMRCIKLLSYKGDIVLDPFSGSGTTAYAAKVTGRQYIGFELSENYWKIGNRRLEQNGLDSWLEPEPEGTLEEFI